MGGTDEDSRTGSGTEDTGRPGARGEPAVSSGRPGQGRRSAVCAGHGARRRAVEEFRRRRDALAAGRGVPEALLRSPAASRQWVSDELTLLARTVADHGREEGAAWTASVRRLTVRAAAAALGLLLLGQLVTALGAGWTASRTAGLLAGLVVAGGTALAAHRHRAPGGALAPVVGADHRLSTSRTVAACWVLFTAYAVLVAAAAPAPGGLALEHSAGLLAVLAAVCGAAVLAARAVTVRVRGQRLQKLRADRPRARDLLTDDAGRGSFPDIQYTVVQAAVLVSAAVRLAQRPGELPGIPWGLAVLSVVSAAVYLAAKLTEGGRPVVLSVVRAREIGDLHSPVRAGDDIEIRGAGFVPPGARTPDRLAQIVVRIGAVHVHVPLVPHQGGFTAPCDTALTVPVPVEVDPGRVEVQVITASGAAAEPVHLDVAE